MNNTHLIRLSTAMSTICTILMLVLTVMAIWFWVNFEDNVQSLSIASRGVIQIETIQLWQIVCAAVYNITATLILVYGLSQLKRLFNNFKQGNFFTEESVQSMHRFCIVMFVSAVFRVLSPTVLSLLLTINNGPNQKALIVTFGSNEFWFLFIAATFLAITWSFKEGQELANENASFV